MIGFVSSSRLTGGWDHLLLPAVKRLPARERKPQSIVPTFVSWWLTVNREVSTGCVMALGVGGSSPLIHPFQLDLLF
jgi:hypothetical protein